MALIETERVIHLNHTTSFKSKIANQLIRACILAGIAGYISYLLLTDQLSLYIAPRMMIYIKIALSILLLIVISLIRATYQLLRRQPVPSHSCSCSCQTDAHYSNPRHYMTYALFIVPLIIVFFTPETTIGSAMAAKKGIILNASQSTRATSLSSPKQAEAIVIEQKDPKPQLEKNPPAAQKEQKVKEQAVNEPTQVTRRANAAGSEGSTNAVASENSTNTKNSDVSKAAATAAASTVQEQAGQAPTKAAADTKETTVKPPDSTRMATETEKETKATPETKTKTGTEQNVVVSSDQANQTNQANQEKQAYAQTSSQSNPPSEQGAKSSAPSITEEQLDKLFPTSTGMEAFAKLGKKLYQQDEIIVDEQHFMEILTTIDLYMDNFIGKKLTIEGFVYHDDTLAANQLILGRFAVQCCTADSMPYGVIVQADSTKPYKVDSWLRMTGTIGKTRYFDSDVIVLQATNVQDIQPSATPYVYPNPSF